MCDFCLQSRDTSDDWQAFLPETTAVAVGNIVHQPLLASLLLHIIPLAGPNHIRVLVHNVKRVIPGSTLLASFTHLLAGTASLIATVTATVLAHYAQPANAQQFELCPQINNCALSAHICVGPSPQTLYTCISSPGGHWPVATHLGVHEGIQASTV